MWMKGSNTRMKTGRALLASSLWGEAHHHDRGPLCGLGSPRPYPSCHVVVLAQCGPPSGGPTALPDLSLFHLDPGSTPPASLD